MSPREQLLRELVSGSRSIAALSKDLASFEWDSNEEVVTVSRSDVSKILAEYVSGCRSASDVRAWAEAIEGRDDIGFSIPDEEMLRDILFELANPELCHDLTPLLAQHLLGSLRA